MSSGFLAPGRIGPQPFGGRAQATPWYRAGGAPMPVAAYQPIGAASLAASYVNLANPGVYDAAPGVAPSFAAATGWAFDGGSQYLNTGVVPASGWSMIIRFSNAQASPWEGMCGAYSSSGAQRFLLVPSDALGNRRYGAGGILAVAGAAPAGVMAIAGQTAYYNNSSDGSIGSGAIPVAPIYIGALNGTTEIWSGKIQAAAIYDTSTDSAIWLPAVSAAMAALTA